MTAYTPGNLYAYSPEPLETTEAIGMDVFDPEAVKPPFVVELVSLEHGSAEVTPLAHRRTRYERRGSRVVPVEHLRFALADALPDYDTMSDRQLEGFLALALGEDCQEEGGNEVTK